MKSIINKPYPFLSNSYRIAIIKVLIIGVFTAFFLYHFDNDGEGLRFFITEGALIAACQFVFLFALPKLIFKNHNLKQLPLWQYIVWLFLFIIIGYLVIYIYLYCFYYQLPFKLNALICFIKSEIPIGLVFTFVIVVLDYLFVLKQELTTTKMINDQISHHKDAEIQPSLALDTTESPEKQIAQNDTFLFYDDQQKKSITLKKSSILFIKAADNYVEIFHLNDINIITKQLLRNTLNAIELNTENDFLDRVHRSYLCHLNKVNKLGGNSKGYELHFAETNEIVPVSRTRSEAVIEKINKLFKN